MHRQTNMSCGINWRQNFSRPHPTRLTFSDLSQHFMIVVCKLKNTVYTWCNWKFFLQLPGYFKRTAIDMPWHERETGKKTLQNCVFLHCFDRAIKVNVKDEARKRWPLNGEMMKNSFLIKSLSDDSIVLRNRQKLIFINLRNIYIPLKKIRIHFSQFTSLFNRQFCHQSSLADAWTPVNLFLTAHNNSIIWHSSIFAVTWDLWTQKPKNPSSELVHWTMESFYSISCSIN